MSKMKFTSVLREKYELSMVSGICIGLVKDFGGGMSEVVCNTILPDTDEEYEQGKETIEGRMRLFAEAPTMYKLLDQAADMIMHTEYAEFSDTIRALLARINEEK